MVAAILATLVAASLTGYFTVGQEVNANTAEKMHLLSENAQRSLDASLNDIVQSVEMTSYLVTSRFDSMRLVELGANKPAQERTPEQTAQLNAYIAEQLAQIEGSFGNVASHSNGVVAYYCCIGPDISATEHGFYFSRLGKVGFERKEPIDLAKLDPADHEHDGWYFTTIERGVPTWAGPYLARELGDAPIVSFLTPIYKSGILLGIVGMDIPFDAMIGKINSLEVYQSGYACLLDDHGNVIYHPEYGTGVLLKDNPKVFDGVDFSGETNGLAAILYDHAGEDWQMAYATLADGMKLVVTAPVREIIAPWTNLLMAVPFIGVVILAIFVALAHMGTNAVIRPLQELTEGANRLAAGDYDLELNYRSADEVGRLTDAFRRLRDHLQVYTSNLNSDSFVDALTGVKNAQAFSLSAAQVNDSIGHAGDEEVHFAIAVFECLDAQRLAADFGDDYANRGIQTLCELVCRVYSQPAVFRVSERRFVVILQGRNYANREELLCDFDIWAHEGNAQATEPWFQVHAAKGMATFRPQEDEGVAAVLERATQRMESA